MAYSISNAGGTIVVSLTGELTLSDEEKFREASFEIQSMEGSKCVLDLTKLQFLDSAGLGLLLVLKEMCEEKGKSVCMRVGDSPVAEILEISEFDSLIPYE